MRKQLKDLLHSTSQLFFKNWHKLVLLLDRGISHIRWTRLLVIILIVIIFPFPNLFLNHNYKIEIVHGSSNPKNTQAKIDIKNTNLQSASIFSRLVNEEIRAPGISVCVKNDLKVIPPGFQIASSSITEEAGAISLKVINLDTSKEIAVYTKVGTSTCEIFPEGHIEITSDIVFNSLTAFQNINGQEVPVATYINPQNSQVKIKVLFDWGQYFFDVFYTLLGIGIVIQIFSALYTFIRKNKL